MNVITRLFSRSRTDAPPWTDESIYSLLRAHTDPESGVLDSGNLALPDEPPASHSEIRWAPGAHDGVMGHHGGEGATPGVGPQIARTLDTVARTGNARGAAEIYALFQEESVLSSIDRVIELLAQQNSPIQPHLAEFAVNLATRSRHRGPVKAGIALIGFMRLTEYEGVVMTLGLHEEFTLFSATAFRNMLSDPTSALWRLAKSVDGWGRIQVIERLVPTDREDIRRWLRTEGFKNSVLYEYLALTAAVHGGLRAALDGDTLTEQELIAAGEIIRSMIAADQGPGGGLNQYPDAGRSCLAYLIHARAAPPELRNFLASLAILRYVEGDKRDTADRLKCGWNESIIADVHSHGAELTRRSGWQALVEQQLDSEVEEAFWIANSAARELRLDAFRWHWRRVQAEPQIPARWYDVMRSSNQERIDQVLALAELQLPLDLIASGPAEALGLGKEFLLHSCLDFVLQDLRRFPGKGARLVLAGLRSPVVRNRNMALAALRMWNRQIWPPDILPAMRRAAEEEPRTDVAERIRELISSPSDG
jgi:hypothetical protein